MKSVTYNGNYTARPFKDNPDVVFSPDARTHEVNDDQAEVLAKDYRFDVPALNDQSDDQSDDQTAKKTTAKKTTAKKSA